MITGKDILQDMYEAVKGLTDKTFLMERPASTSDDVSSFIVCKLPSVIFNSTIGGEDYNLYTTTAQFEVFIRDKVSSTNTNAIDIMKMDKTVRALRNLFPITGKSCMLTRPEETLVISDGKQFHCTIIQARVITK